MIDAFEIPCRELVEMLTDYLEGNLDPIEVEKVDAHLGVCPPCVYVLEQFRRTIALGQQLGEADIDALAPDVRSELLHAFSALR